MTDRYRIYTKILKVLKGMMKLSHPGHLVPLAMLIAGIVMSRNAYVIALRAETGAEAKDKSREMRLRRWVKHLGINADVIALPGDEPRQLKYQDDPDVVKKIVT